MRNIKHRRLIASVIALGLLATACGDDEPEVSDTPTTEPADDGTEPTGTETGTAAPEDIKFDVGVTEDTITLGLLADLTGVFAPLVTDIVSAQEVYWDKVNAAGGIAGRQIELIVEDAGYDVTRNVENYEKIRNEVAAIPLAVGSPHTAAIVPSLEEDDMVVVPLTWYSGWADPEIGSNVLEQGTNYCLEAMNVLSWVNDNHEGDSPPTLAIISFPGEYGQDGATGAKIAAEELGMEIVYDGEAAVVPGQDQTAVISEIVRTSPDWVFATTNPTTLGEIMGGAVAQGFQGNWTGSVPSYDFRMLDSPLAEAIDAYYYQSAYNVAFGTDVPGMQELVDAMTEAEPDARVSDAAVLGWIEATIIDTVLRQAAENGDLTRAGILDAALSIDSIDFGGLQPTQTYAGEPNDYVLRESAMFKPNLEYYNEGGGASATYANGGNTGSELIQDFFASDLAANYDYQGACFTG
ncbi:MAG: ABC transporter substrate-binding protein [Actinobacteria bacterium]|nr:ABC transporter substrate-binding protein [Actinomycetota bacterium]